MTIGRKEGLATREEIKLFTDLAADQIEMNVLYKTGIKILAPALLDALDNKVGDKLPEPWQTYAEDLITSVYVALQDKVITTEEVDDILDKVAAVLAAEIEIPLIDEADRVLAFEYLLKMLAVQVRIAIKERLKK